jgi:hypothetical protein
MDGLYNVPEDPESGYVYYRTVRRLPSRRRFLAERSEIAARLRRSVAAFLSDSDIPSHNEVLEAVFDRFSVGENPSDRTMCFFVGELRAFTPDFVHMLQTDVLVDFPLWRLLAQFEEQRIGVYPSGAWFGEEWIEGRFDDRHPAYRQWWTTANEYRERRNGPLRRQLAYVRRLILGSMPIARRAGFAFLGAFERYQPHLAGQPIWILQTVPDDELSWDVPLAPVRTSPVAADGTILPRFAEVTGEGPWYWLVTHLPDSAQGLSFAMKRASGEVVGRVAVAEVILDEVLAATEHRRGPG